MEVEIVECNQCGKSVLTYHTVKGFKLCDNCNMQQTELGMLDDPKYVVFFENKDGSITDALFFRCDDSAFEQFHMDVSDNGCEDQVDAEKAFLTDEGYVCENYTIKAKELYEYTVFNNVEGITIFTSNKDSEFIDFVKIIVKENEDFDYSVLGVSDAIEYINEYCANLDLIS